jgi:hypothetical protein
LTKTGRWVSKIGWRRAEEGKENRQGYERTEGMRGDRTGEWGQGGEGRKATQIDAAAIEGEKREQR